MHATGADRQIWLMTAYDKDEAADLTAKQKKALRTAIEANWRDVRLGGFDRADHGGYGDGKERLFWKHGIT